PQALRLPRRIGDEVLEGLVAGGVAQASMHRLHGLPLAVVEQPVEILARRLALGPTRETVGKPVGKLTQPPQQRAGPRLGHRRNGTKLSTSVQVPKSRTSSTAIWT